MKYRLDLSNQRLHGERLFEKARTSQLVNQPLVGMEGRDDDYRNDSARAGAELAGHLPAGAVRQIYVEQHEGWDLLVNVEESLGNGSASSDVIVARAKVSPDSAGEDFVILDDQYRLVQGCLPGSISTPRLRSSA